MKRFQVLVFLLLSSSVALGREVNRAVKERSSDTDILHDFFDDDDVIDERGEDAETEISSEEDDFFDDDDATDERSDEADTEISSEDDEESEDSNPAGRSGVCGKSDLENFPLRLRDWFYIIMNHSPKNNKPEVEDDGGDDDDDDEAPLLPLKETVAESREDRKFVEGVLWQFCELDKEPRDSQLSGDEFRDLRDPIVSMEPCIDPFLKGCDTSSDGQVSLQEWGQCLGLENDEIQDNCNTIIK